MTICVKLSPVFHPAQFYLLWPLSSLYRCVICPIFLSVTRSVIQLTCTCLNRPKGYVEPPSSAASKAKLGLAQMFAASLNSGPTTVVLLENMVPIHTIKEDNERMDVSAICSTN